MAIKKVLAVVLKYKRHKITLTRERFEEIDSGFDKLAFKYCEHCDVVGNFGRSLVKREFLSDKGPPLSSKEEVSKFVSLVEKAIPAFAKAQAQREAKADKLYKAQQAKIKAARRAALVKLIKQNPLPEFLTLEDLIAPEEGDQLTYTQKQEFFKSSDMGFSDNPLYHVEGWGWCLPVLRIASARGRGTTDRAYAVRLKDAAPVRVGLGPHVTAQVTIYLKKSNYQRLLKALKPLLDQGGVEANQARDSRSTRSLRRYI